MRTYGEVEVNTRFLITTSISVHVYIQKIKYGLLMYFQG
jgi:hypothetical protein